MYPFQTEPPKIGKVRIVSTVGNIMVAETTDKVSAFDVVLPFQVPKKGAILNIIAATFMWATVDIIPNCLLYIPHPRIAIWKKTTPFKFEVIVRGYNNKKSSFYRDFVSTGKTNPWGYILPEGIGVNQKFPDLYITPTTKAPDGEHDESISREEIINQGLATEKELSYIYEKTRELFQRGTEMAKNLGLILVDTKYEFGKTDDGTIYLIDEVHTPDSSRYWYSDTYEKCLETGEDPKELSKEFLRQWLIEHGFQGKEGDVLPEFSEEFIQSISERYLELYTKMGMPLSDIEEPDEDPYEIVCEFLAKN